MSWSPLCRARKQQLKQQSRLVHPRLAMRNASLLVGLFVAATLQGVTAKKRNNGGSRKVSSRKKECEQTTCASVHADDAVMPRDNCILQCQSAECYRRVYADNELEPGEIDTKRSREFTQCVTKEGRSNKRASLPSAALQEAEPVASEADLRAGGANEQAGASDAGYHSDPGGAG